MSVRRCVLALAASSAAAVTLVQPAAAVAGGPTHLGPQTVTADDRAGYAGTPARLHSVSAVWVQPQTGCAAKATYATFEVRLAGHDRPFRVGTSLECHGGSAVSYAFVGGPGARVSEAVQPGDLIRASIEVHRHGMSYSIEDDTQGWGEGGGSGSSGPGPKWSNALVLVGARTSEAGQVLPVTKFAQVMFDDCQVNGQPMGRQQLRRIVLHTPNGGLARPSAFLDNRRFTVHRPGV